MEFAILGPLAVLDQHRRIEVSPAKERLLLTVLIMHANEVISPDRLIDVLWESTPPVTAANTLQTYISHLRRALEPDHAPRAKGGVLCTRGNGYVLAVAPEAIDAVRFERLAGEGRDMLASDPARAAEKLHAALALWRDEPLTEFSSTPFTHSEIARLTELRVAALEDRVEADLALGQHAALCAELSQAVIEQPLRERLWSQLIRALYRCGRQADALATFARLRKQLAEQLGIAPSPELVELQQAVLTQRPDLEWHPAPPQPGRALSGPALLPIAEKLRPQAHTALAADHWQAGYYAYLKAGDRDLALRDAERPARTAVSRSNTVRD